jgi:hypothetical protein
MAPTLIPGRIVLGVWPWRLAAGDVVIVRHGGFEKIKRIADLRQNEIFLTGDNSLQSTDSRTFGWIECSSVVAKVVWPKVKRTKD